MERILLVEDDDTLVRTLRTFLSEEGFALTTAAGQQEAVELLSRRDFDLALVDISLADGNGFGVCAAAQARGLAVIFLTAASDEHTVVTGLDMGADDFIAKPFRPRELLSRIRSVLRRTGKRQSVVTIGELFIDMERGMVSRAGQDVYLSALEYRLLLIFLNNRGRLLTRARLLDEIWDSAGDYVSDNTLTVYIKRLREKLGDDPQNPVIIRTVRGLGYRMEG